MADVERRASVWARAARRTWFGLAAFVRLDGPPTPGRFRQLQADNAALRAKLEAKETELADAKAKAAAAAKDVRAMTATTEKIIQRDLMQAARYAAEQELIQASLKHANR